MIYIEAFGTILYTSNSSALIMWSCKRHISVFKFNYGTINILEFAIKSINKDYFGTLLQK